MKSQVSITIALIAIILVSCALESTPDLSESTSTITSQSTATFTPEPTKTFTPEPTVTFTPEPTATFTPEPTKTFTPEPTATFTPEPTATFTPESTATPTPQLFSLKVFAFWDYNGNGRPDNGEPPLKGITSRTGSVGCTTEGNGRCAITLPSGRHTVKIDTANARDLAGAVVPGLSYMFFGTDILDPGRGFSVVITADAKVSVALAQGPYPVPANNVGFADGIYKPFGAIWAGDTEPHGAIDLAVLGEDNPNTPPVIIYASVTGQIQELPDSTPEQLSHGVNDD